MNSNKNNKALAVLKAFEQQTGLHPLRQAALKSQLLERVASEDVPPLLEKRLLWNSSVSSVPAIFAAVFCVLIAGGAALATETSTPGDIFHPLKLVSEKIELRLAPSNEMKATIEARQANERIEELTHVRAKASSTEKAEIKARLEDRSKSIEVETKVRVEKTLESLEQVRNNLSAQGNERAVRAIDKSIERLKSRATKSRIRNQEVDRQITPLVKPEIENEVEAEVETENKEEKNSSDEDKDESEIEVQTPRIRLRN